METNLKDQEDKASEGARSEREPSVIGPTTIGSYGSIFGSEGTDYTYSPFLKGDYEKAALMRARTRAKLTEQEVNDLVRGAIPPVPGSAFDQSLRGTNQAPSESNSFLPPRGPSPHGYKLSTKRSHSDASAFGQDFPEHKPITKAKKEDLTQNRSGHARPSGRCSRTFPQAPKEESVIDHSHDRMFLDFLRLVKSARTLNHIVDDSADILLAAANLLVTVKTEDARRLVARMRDHYTRAGQVQGDHLGTMEESPLLRVITMPVVSAPMDDALSNAIEDTKKLRSGEVYGKFVQMVEDEVDMGPG